ncbi:carbonic anhydrase family protein [Pseudarthrobacter sp. J75]|nr:carbonic anhydrase family protein [Pseudarthrobacter sp. J75]MEE2522082.1 carbonic anhydrase family protein [Pseudarthrobacter sp. J47]MEE2529007.1 carbonic anhydrase family protein [Pseudarthrobacter sp. J75]
MLIGSGLGVLAFLTGCARNLAPAAQPAGAAAPAWSYEGAGGPEHWGELSPGFDSCSAGTSQSPVDIPAAAGVVSTEPVAINYSASEAVLTDNGHTTELHSLSPQGITVGGKDYAFRQMHFHAPSEHHLNGVAFDAEFHFVHQADDGELAVIGVLAAAGGAGAAAGNAIWEPFVSGLPAAAAASGEKVPAGAVVDFPALLPSELDHFRYSGSLTTPPCTEKVRWLLLQQPIELGADQLASLKAAHSGNNRPVQPLHNREVAGVDS